MSNPMWPFLPLAGMTEAVEWLTAVVQTKSAETREQLRDYPLRTFSLNYVFYPAQWAAARTLTRRGVYFRMPDWSHIYSLSDAASLPDGDYVVWRDWNDYDEVSIASGVIGSSEYVGTGRLMPVLECKVDEAWANARIANNIATASFTLQTADGDDESETSDDALYADYSGYPMISDAPVVGSDATDEGTEWEVDSADNSVALPDDVIIRDYADEKFTVAWYRKGAEWWALRRWLYSLAGRFGLFWLPSYGADMASPAHSTGKLVVATYDSNETYFCIDIDGVLYPRQLASYTTNSAGKYVLTFDEDLPTTGTIRKAMYMRFCRLNVDRIEFSYNGGIGVGVNVQCVRVPFDE